MATKCPKCDFENPDTQKFCGDCGTQLGQDIPEVTKTLETPSQELRRGTTFAGRYEIVEKLGKGKRVYIELAYLNMTESRRFRQPVFSKISKEVKK